MHDGPRDQPMAAVDPEFRVHGLSGLRVAEASIMPTVVSGSTQAACILIGEKCADPMLTPRYARRDRRGRARFRNYSRTQCRLTA